MRETKRDKTMGSDKPMTRNTAVSRHVSIGILAASVFYLLIMCIPGIISRYSYWTDELFTVAFISEDWGNMFNKWILPDVHPPLYFMIAKIWAIKFGTSEIALRSLSLAWSLGTIVLMWNHWRCKKELRRLVFLALVISNPYFLYYSQEARGYSMLVFFCTVVVMTTLNKSTDQQAKGINHLWFYYVAIISASLTHFFGFVYAFITLALDLIQARLQKNRIVTILALGIISMWPIVHIGMIGQLGSSQINQITLEPQSASDVFHAFTVVGLPYLETGVNWITTISAGILIVSLIEVFLLKKESHSLKQINKTLNDIMYLFIVIGINLLALVIVSRLAPITTYRNLLTLMAPTSYLVASICTSILSLTQSAKSRSIRIPTLVTTTAIGFLVVVSIKVSDLNITAKSQVTHNYRALAKTLQETNICSRGCYITDYDPKDDGWGAQILDYYFNKYRLYHLDIDMIRNESYNFDYAMPIVGTYVNKDTLELLNNKYGYKEFQGQSTKEAKKQNEGPIILIRE